MIFNDYFGTNYHYIKDKIYLVKNETYKKYSLIDVTNAFKNK